MKKYLIFIATISSAISAQNTTMPMSNNTPNQLKKEHVVQKSDIKENSTGYVMIPLLDGDVLYIDKDSLFPPGTNGWYYLEKAANFAKRDMAPPPSPCPPAQQAPTISDIGKTILPTILPNASQNNQPITDQSTLLTTPTVTQTTLPTVATSTQSSLLSVPSAQPTSPTVTYQLPQSGSQPSSQVVTQQQTQLPTLYTSTTDVQSITPTNQNITGQEENTNQQKLLKPIVIDGVTYYPETALYASKPIQQTIQQSLASSKSPQQAIQQPLYQQQYQVR